MKLKTGTAAIYILLIAVILMASPIQAAAQAITIGPTIHCYFPKGKPKLVFGIEASYHHFSDDKPVIPGGVIGFEAGKDLKIMYGEFQLSREKGDNSFEGLAIGMFRKMTKDETVLTGFQTTAWKTFYLAGGEIRIRLAERYIDMGIGTFGKLPIPIGRTVGHM